MKGDALDMRQIEAGGPWVLSALPCSSNRRAYVQRAHAILTFYFVTLGYCIAGRNGIEAAAEKQGLKDSTQIRLTLEDRTLQASYGQHKQFFGEIGPRLTNQAFLML